MNQNSATTEFPLSPSLKKIELTWTKILCTIFSIFTYICDIAFDIVVAITHYKNGNGTFFALTVTVIVLPAIIMTIFSVIWYLSDTSEVLKASTTQWIIRIIFLALLMAPVLRNFEALYYALRSTRCSTEVEKENYVRRMVFENTDAAFLRLFEAFLECAPQLLLQIYIIAQVQYDKPNEISITEIIQLICIFTSLFSMACSITSYLCFLRQSLDHKTELSCSITIFPILWRLFELTARLMALGLLASILLPYFCLICSMHFIIMFVWIRIMGTKFCNNAIQEFIYNLIMALVFIFCYINLKDTPTRARCIFYYTFIFVENSILISIWYYLYLPESHFRLPALIMQFVCFTLAIVIMIFYYTLLHPTRGRLPESFRMRNYSIVRMQSIADKCPEHEEVICAAKNDDDDIQVC